MSAKPGYLNGKGRGEKNYGHAPRETPFVKHIFWADQKSRPIKNLKTNREPGPPHLFVNRLAARDVTGALLRVLQVHEEPAQEEEKRAHRLEGYVLLSLRVGH